MLSIYFERLVLFRRYAPPDNLNKTRQGYKQWLDHCYKQLTGDKAGALLYLQTLVMRGIKVKLIATSPIHPRPTCQFNGHEMDKKLDPLASSFTTLTIRSTTQKSMATFFAHRLILLLLLSTKFYCLVKGNRNQVGHECRLGT